MCRGARVPRALVVFVLVGVGSLHVDRAQTPSSAWFGATLP